MRKSYYRQISLAPLGPEAIKALLAELLGEHPSLNGLPDLVQERTAGNPFFIEEVVRSLAESGNLAGKRGDYRLVRPIDDDRCPADGQHDPRGADRPALGAREEPSSERGRDRQGVLRARARASCRRSSERRPGAGAACADRSGVHLRAGALPGSDLRVQAPTHAGGRLPLAARRAPRGGASPSGRGAGRSSIADKLDERSALLAQHWEAAGEPLEAARWSARAAAWAESTTSPRRCGTGAR